MSDRLAGKVALITGAARGQGAAEAALFAAEGARVVIGDIRAELLTAVAAELTDKGHEVVAHVFDVRDEDGWSGAVALAEERFGRLDVLVNNAGVLEMAGVEATTMETWERVVATNQTGVWLGMKAVAPAMRRAGGGSIINTSSIYGLIGSGGATAYQGTKGAVRLLTKTAAVEFAGAGIRVNSVHPGIIDSPMVAEDVPEEVVPVIVGATPLQRMGRPDEVAYGVLFLASDEASYVTGSELVIDGGYSTQ
jgi:cyclopentanol dehydrogenase